jgi:hypothetical protein
MLTAISSTLPTQRIPAEMELSACCCLLAACAAVLENHIRILQTMVASHACQPLK